MGKLNRSIFRTTASTTFPVTWRCSRCGQRNEQELTLSETRETSLHTPVISEEMKAVQEKKSGQRAREALQRRVDEILAERARGRFRKAELDQCCSGCGHREAWAKLRFSRFGIAVGALFVTGIAASLFLLYEGRPIGAAWVAGAVCAASLLWVLYRGIRTLATERRIALLPQTSLPSYRFKMEGTALRGDAVTEKHTKIRRV